MIIDIPAHSDFSMHNIPFGIFSTPERSPRVGVAIGDHILDMVAVGALGVFDFDVSVLHNTYLNDFIALGKSVTSKVRTDIQAWIRDDSSVLAGKPALFVPQQDAQMHLPVKVGDYTDFYSSIEHASNVGKMFRGPDNALLPNWRHLPVAYHGRASSIIVSGQPVYRPKGQVIPKGATTPVFQPTNRLDFELEMAFIVGKDTALGQSVAVDEAEDYLFGMVIFNDWSARDIQKWEYVPLGPFLGKSFASSISPWVVTMEALEPFRTQGYVQSPEVLPYLRQSGPGNFDIELEALLTPHGQQSTTISRSNFKYLYWTMAQQLAHHTINGCNIRIGDMMASGTISGPEKSTYGSLLEITWGGTQPLRLGNGEVRTFIEDYDKVTLRAAAQKGSIRVGFGKVESTVFPPANQV